MSRERRMCDGGAGKGSDHTEPCLAQKGIWLTLKALGSPTEKF